MIIQFEIFFNLWVEMYLFERLLNIYITETVNTVNSPLINSFLDIFSFCFFFLPGYGVVADNRNQIFLRKQCLN